MERGCRREDSAAAIFGCLGALPGRWGARRRRQELGRLPGGPVLAELGHRRPPQRALDHTAYGAPTFRLRIGTCPGTRYRRAFGSRSRGGLGSAAMRPTSRGARRPSCTSTAGRWTRPWRPPRRPSPPAAGWCAPVRLACRARAGAAAAQPSWRAVVSRGRAAAGVAFGHVVTQMRGEQHRRSAATGAQKADSLCSSTVFLGVSRPTLGGAKSASPRCRMLSGAGRYLCHRWRQSGSVRLPRKLFLNPVPLGCHHLISIFLRLYLLLSLFVCVSAQVMYGISAASGHIGDVVLWRLNPPAAGEVRVSAGGHRGGCAGAGL